MARIWSKTKKILEEDLMCESLRGRVKYFLTHYHNAPDNYGRFCIRVDGREYVQANPYNESAIFADANRIQAEQQVHSRVWEHGHFLYDEENQKIEEIAERIAVRENRMDVWQVMHAIDEYLEMDVHQAIVSNNELIRMFAVMDRRIGKRTLITMASQIDEQPEWLQFFYKLRLSSEK